MNSTFFGLEPTPVHGQTVIMSHSSTSPEILLRRDAVVLYVSIMFLVDLHHLKGEQLRRDGQFLVKYY